MKKKTNVTPIDAIQKLIDNLGYFKQCLSLTGKGTSRAIDALKQIHNVDAIVPDFKTEKVGNEHCCKHGKKMYIYRCIAIEKV